MDRYAGPTACILGRNLNRRTARAHQPPQHRGAAMAEHGIRARGKHGCHPVAAQTELLVAECVDTLMKPVEPACFDPSFDCARTEACGKQLAAGNHAVLASGESRYRLLALHPAPAWVPIRMWRICVPIGTWRRWVPIRTCSRFSTHMGEKLLARPFSPPTPVSELGCAAGAPALQVLDLGGDLGGGLFGVREEHRRVGFVEEIVVDAGEAGAERALDHDHLLGL
jgi:hypothetical protein